VQVPVGKRSGVTLWSQDRESSLDLLALLASPSPAQCERNVGHPPRSGLSR